MKTFFKGDEEWELAEIEKNSPENGTFFYNWFSGKKGKLLEAGCGTGNFVVVFAKKGFKVTGIEIDKKRAGLAKKNCQKYNVRAKIIKGDIRKLPFKTNAFDFVFCHGVVEHFPETQKALIELNRVLKDNSYAMISVPAIFSSFSLFKYLQIAIDEIFKTNLWNCGYEKSFTPWKFKRMLEKAGFKIIDKKINQSGIGKRIPLIGKIIRVLDKPFYWTGIGGRFMHFYCEKKGK